MSKLNCRPGDLAVVVRSVAGNEGRILTVLRWIGPLTGYEGSDYWETDVRLQTRHGYTAPIVRDSCIRRLSDPGADARDETLEWLPVPSSTKEHA